MDYKSGQFVNITVETSEGYLTKPYSIESAPHEKYLKITLKNAKTGGVSQTLCEKAKEDQIFDIKGPFGVFCLDDKHKKHVFIAGGTGITPFMSMMKDAEHKKLDLRLTALFSFRTPKHIILKKEINRLKKNPSIKFLLTMTRIDENDKWAGERGRWDIEKLRKYKKDIDFKTSLFYICGPNTMAENITSYLKELGVDKSRIRIEGWG